MIRMHSQNIFRPSLLMVLYQITMRECVLIIIVNLQVSQGNKEIFERGFAQKDDTKRPVIPKKRR